MPGSTTYGEDNTEISPTVGEKQVLIRQPPAVAPRPSSVHIQPWQAPPSTGENNNYDVRHARSNSMDSLESSGSSTSSSAGNGSIPYKGADNNTAEYIPSRVVGKAPKLPSHNPMQFVKVKSPMLIKMEEPAKQTKEVKICRESPKESGEDWQSNLDNWKSRRRKVSEKVIQRAEEMRQIEAVEQLRQEQVQQQQRKIKKFSEIVEKRSTRSYNLDLYIGQGNDSGLGGTPEPDEMLDSHNLIIRSDTSEGMTSESESIDSDVHKSEKVYDNTPKVPLKPHSWLKKEAVTDEFDTCQILSDKEYTFSPSVSSLDNFSSTEPSDVEGLSGDTEAISSEEDIAFSTDVDKDKPSNDSCNHAENSRSECKVFDLSSEDSNCTQNTMDIPQDNNHSFKICIKQGDHKGFGFTLKGGKDQGCSPYIENIVKYGPADITGLKEGDQILSLNGEYASGYSHASLVFTVKQATYTGVLDIIIYRQKINDIASLSGTKVANKKSSFAEKLAIFSNASKLPEENKPLAKTNEVKRESLVLRRRSAFENGQNEISQKSTTSSNGISIKTMEIINKRFSAEITSQFSLQENGCLKKGPPPPIPLKPKLKSKLSCDNIPKNENSEKSNILLPENINSNTKSKLPQSTDIYEDTTHTESYLPCTDELNKSSNDVTSNECKLENAIDSDTSSPISSVNDLVGSFRICSNNEELQENHNYTDPEKLCEDVETSVFSTNMENCVGFIDECSKIDDYDDANKKNIEINSFDRFENIANFISENNVDSFKNQDTEDFLNKSEPDFTYADNILSEKEAQTFSSILQEKEIISDIELEENTVPNSDIYNNEVSHDINTFVSETTVTFSKGDFLFEKPTSFDFSQTIDETPNECYWEMDTMHKSVLSDSCNVENSITNVDDFITQEDKQISVDVEQNLSTSSFERIDESNCVLNKNHISEEIVNDTTNSSPLCLPLEKIDEDDVISASTTTSSETPDTETVIETLPTNVSPLPNDESNGEESSKSYTNQENDANKLHKTLSSESSTVACNQISIPDETDNMDVNSSTVVETSKAVLLNEENLQIINDYSSTTDVTAPTDIEEEYSRELDESLDQITSLDIIDEIEQRLMHQLEQQGNEYEDVDENYSTQIEDYFSEDLLDDLTPRNIQPPSEPPPPPPIEDPSEIPLPPMNRANSTKRIKKEIWRRRSDFLGLNAEEGIDIDAILPPPLGMEEILKQEIDQNQWLEKRASLAESDSTVLPYTNIAACDNEIYAQGMITEESVKEKSDCSKLSVDALTEHWKDYVDEEFYDSSIETQGFLPNDVPSSVVEDNSKLNDSPQHKAKQTIYNLGAVPKAKIMDSYKWITEKVAPASRKSAEPVIRQTSYNQNYWLAQDGERKRNIPPDHISADRRYSLPPSSNASPDVTVRTWNDREYDFQKQRPKSVVWNPDIDNELKEVNSELYSQKHDVSRTQSLDSRREFNCDTDVLESEVHKCSCCGKGLCEGSAMGIEALRLYFHMECFRCSVCHMLLGNGLSGTDVQVKDEQLFCCNCFSVD